MPDPNLCVLIDFENIAAGTEKAQLGKFNIHTVMNRLKEKGRILISRAYGDWGRFAKFKQDLLREGVSMMELTSYRGQDKNRADIALVVDAMELAFTREHIDTYVLLSGDSDFTPLVMKLKEFNKRVIGVGTRQSTSRLLSAACDEFIFYENIRRGRSSTETSSEEDVISLTKVEAFAKLVETLEGLVRDTSGPVSTGVLKQSLLRKVPTFDEAEFGYSGFARFLESAKQKGLISIQEHSRAGGYLVSLTDPGAEETASTTLKLPPLSEEAERLRDILIANNANPATHLMRHVLVHELVDHVQERAAKKKRNTLFYLYGDMNRRCRKTDPMVPADLVKNIIDSLHSAGTILHPDGNPVRSKKANFVIQHDPEELLNKLCDYYLRLLLRSGEKLLNSTAVSELLWGDTEHQLEVEQALSWVQLEEENTEQVSQDTSEGSQAPAQTKQTVKQTSGEKKSDESLTPQEPKEEPQLDTQEKPKRRRRARKKPSDAIEAKEPESEQSEKSEEKPKRKRRTRKPTAQASEKQPAEDKKEEKPTRRKRTRKPAAQTPDVTIANDAKEEKPKRRRRTTKSATQKEAAPESIGTNSEITAKAAEKPKRRRATKKSPKDDE